MDTTDYEDWSQSAVCNGRAFSGESFVQRIHSVVYLRYHRNHEMPLRPLSGPLRERPIYCSPVPVVRRLISPRDSPAARAREHTITLN